MKLAVVLGAATAQPTHTAVRQDQSSMKDCPKDSFLEPATDTELPSDSAARVRRALQRANQDAVSDRPWVNCKTNSSKFQCLPTTYHQLQTLQFLHCRTRRLKQAEFRWIEKISGRPFTHDAYSGHMESGVQPMCTSATPGLAEFMDFDPTGHHVWISAPFGDTLQMMLHFITAKQKSPHNTSACVLLPDWAVLKAKPLLKGWERLHTYPKGSRVFDPVRSSPDDVIPHTLPGIPWALQVWHSPVSVPEELIDQLRQRAATPESEQMGIQHRMILN